MAGYTWPCIVDVKIGKRTYEDTAEPAKMKSMMAKDLASTSHSLGVRLSGMKVVIQPALIVDHDQARVHFLFLARDRDGTTLQNTM